MNAVEELSKFIQAGNLVEVQKITTELLKHNTNPREILDKGIVDTLSVVGERFSTGEIFIPEMIIAAKAAQKSIEVIKPFLVASGHTSIGKFAIGTVQTDVHDIGKNIVCMLFEGSGFEVMDLGVDVSPEEFISAIEKFKPQILGFSCLINTALRSMQTTIGEIKGAGIRDIPKIIIGGPPTSDSFAKQIGADFYAEDAHIGVTIAKSIVSI